MRKGSVGLVLIVVTLALVPTAFADNVYGPTVDDRVAAAAQATSDPATLLNIIAQKPPLGDLSKVRDALKAVKAIIPTDISGAGGVAAQIRVDALGKLSADVRVGYVNPDVPVSPSAVTVLTPYGPSAEYAVLDGAPAAWARGYDGAGVGVCVLDSGVDPVADFGTRLVRIPLQGQGSGALADKYGHGSFVAGVLGGRNAQGLYSGVAPGAKIYALKVAKDERAPRTRDFIEAIKWCTTNRDKLGVRVVLIAATEQVATSYSGSILDAAVEQAWAAGLTVVVAAGNLGPDASFFAPANDPFVLTVGALDDVAEASWSTRGTTPDGYARPDILAPGRHIVSVLPAGSTLAGQAPAENVVAAGYGMANGTSFAAPQVAAAAAILLQKDPTLTPDQVKWLLLQTARPVTGASAPALDIAAATAYAGAVGNANEGLLRGNCENPTGKGGACSAPGGAYLNFFDWSKAIEANGRARRSAEQYNAASQASSESDWNASAFWHASAYWDASAYWKASAFWDASAFWK